MSKLLEIKAQRIRDVASLCLSTPLATLVKQCNDARPPLDLHARLLSTPPHGFTLHVAAEFKKASPSKGAMTTEEVQVNEQVLKYANAGASVVSVLTEPKWFKGSLQDMADARLVVENLSMGTSRPLILRKDFIVDEYQIYEARLHGADTLLLIVAITQDDDLRKYITTARSLGMEPLVEAANEEETTRALRAGAKVLGINNRDLSTFVLDMTTTTRCAAVVSRAMADGSAPSDIVMLSLSGIKTREDVRMYERTCPPNMVRGILVGEHLMKSSNPSKDIRELVTEDGDEKSHTGMPWVKICGIVRSQDALVAVRAGAKFVGLIFAAGSPRLVTVSEAQEVVKTVRGFRENMERVVITMEQHPSKRAKSDDDGSHDWLIRGRDALGVALARGPLVVGVFMNQDVAFVNDMVDKVGLDLVQFHGNETWEECNKCKVPYIKVLHVLPANNESRTIDELIGKIQPGGGPIAILLDTTVKTGSVEGGTGITFDWKIAAELARRGFPLMVAGGLTPMNVTMAIQQAGNPPMAVDCSSGVQVKDDARRKDEEAIIAFIKAARRGS